ncbi:unnamed protein product [Darwinula stevensoni]|uniref:TRASH domain-containing protein n=1 Tax=Darwinula stevensoni TaxID=69355 RepID=A0A7R8WXL7_9CRUS|nr:unnamed protein product [Darwinula stevensoni]CAG0878607.1 unnamed protein product [Darwinula stevensoni]
MEVRRKILHVRRNGDSAKTPTFVAATKKRPAPRVETDGEEDKQSCTMCSWCQNLGPRQFTVPEEKESAGKGKGKGKDFCSELCFTQYRRATFKRNQICDWCKNPANSIAHVEYSPTDTQLQFCSEECVKQLKMNVFCKETQAHLKLMRETPKGGTDSTPCHDRILITPDLWTSPRDPDGRGTPTASEAEMGSGVRKIRRRRRTPSSGRLPPAREPEGRSSGSRVAFDLIGSCLPPVTVLVPVPIPIPIPIPIPLPIPIPIPIEAKENPIDPWERRSGSESDSPGSGKCNGLDLSVKKEKTCST